MIHFLISYLCFKKKIFQILFIKFYSNQTHSQEGKTFIFGKTFYFKKVGFFLSILVLGFLIFKYCFILFFSIVFSFLIIFPDSLHFHIFCFISLHHKLILINQFPQVCEFISTSEHIFPHNSLTEHDFYFISKS